MPSRKSFGGQRLINVPMNLPIGQVVNLGRSGKVRRATQGQLDAFRKKQAADLKQREMSKQTREQAEKAGKALGDSSLTQRVSVRQQGETVKTGKSGTLQRFQPDPEVFVGDEPVSKARKTLADTPLMAGDVGTEILLSEVQRQGAKGRKAIGTAQQLAKKAGLRGFKAKQNMLERVVTSKTLGVPNVLLAITAAGISNLAAAGQPAGTTTGAGQQQFLGVEAGTGNAAFASTPSNLQFGSTAATTAGGGGFIGPATRTPVVGSSATGASGLVKNILRGAQAALGRGGSAALGGGATVRPSSPQLIFQAPQQQVIQRSTVTPGAMPAFARRGRNRFGGTGTSSLFASRDQRSRKTLLGS